MAWTAIFVALLFLVLKLIRVLKVSSEEELRGELQSFIVMMYDPVSSAGIDLFQHGEPAYALRIYCAACGEQLQGKTIEHETVGARPNFPTIVTDAEGGMPRTFSSIECDSTRFLLTRPSLPPLVQAIN